MKTRHVVSFLLFSAGLAGLACGQSQLDPVTVPLDVEVDYLTEGGLCGLPDCAPERVAYFSISLSSLAVGDYDIDGSSDPAYAGEQLAGTVSGTAYLKPGKGYHLYASGDLIVSYQMRVTPPTGYSVLIEDVERWQLDGSGNRSYKIRIESDAPSPAGQAAEPRPGRIIWSVGMGQLRNGDPAGSIQMRELSLTADTFKPSALYYDHENPDITVLELGGALRQVYANECLADIQEDPAPSESNHTFWVRFYARTEVFGENPDGTRVVGSPFVEYKIENPNYPTVDRLKITRYWKVPGVRTSWTEIRKSGSTWTVIPWNTGGYPSTTPSQTVVTYSDSDRSETIEVKDAGGILVSKSFNEYKDYPWGYRELYRTVKGYGYSNPLETKLEYEQTSGANYKRIKWKIEPDGYWERYDYFSDGRLRRVYRPFGDLPAVPGDATLSNCEVTEYQYAEDFSGALVLPSTLTTTRGGYSAGQTEIDYDNDTLTLNGMPVVEATRDDYWKSGNYVRTITRTYRADVADAAPANPNAGYYAGKLHSVIYADGAMEAHTYLWGLYNPSTRAFVPDEDGTEFMISVLHGTNASAGNVALSSYGGYTISTGGDYSAGLGFHLIPNKSTCNSTVYSSSGTPIWTEEAIYAGGSWQIVNREITSYQSGLAAFPTWKSADSGDPYVNWTTFEATYGLGYLMTARTDAQGISRSFNYDIMDRQLEEVRYAVTGQPGGGELWTYKSYDAAGQVTSVRLGDSYHYPKSATDLQTDFAYDKAGRLTSKSEPGVTGSTVGVYTTSFAYFWGGDARATRELRSDGGEIVRTTYRDRRTKSVTGSGEVNKYYGYWAQSDGRLREQRRLSATVNGDGWHDTYRDWLGRVNEDVKPSPDGGHVKDHHLYNSAGQLYLRQLKNESWGWIQAAHLWVYDAQGRLLREGMDVNENGTLDDNGKDRVTVHNTSFEYLDNAWWRTVTKKTLTNPDNGSDGVETETRTRLTGLYGNITGGKLIAETATTDANGQTELRRSIVDRTARKLTVTTTVPGSTTVATTVAVNGLKASEVSSTGATTSWLYDAYARLLKTSTRDSVSVELEYYPGTSLVKHRKQPHLGGSGFQQTYYDTMGRVSMESINDSQQWKNKRYAYDTRGQLLRAWGSGQNPVEYEYNDYGWKTKMRLYRGTGVNWDNGTWPGSGQVYDQTIWSYDNSQGGVQTGLVFSKTDPGGSPVSFTYNDHGQIKTRTWARGVTTTYSYEESAGYRTGELKTIDYGDSTPDVSFYYSNLNGKFTRTGRVRRVSDATGLHEFFYRTNDDQLQAQRLSSTWYGSQSSNSRQIYRSYDALGRPLRVRLGWEDSEHSGNDLATLEVESIHYYSSATGRLSKLTGHRPWIVGADFNYEYQPGSDQVSAVDGGWYVEGYRREIQRQSWREVVERVETKWGTASKGRFDYNHDWVGQFANRSATGSIFEEIGYESGIKDEYLYTPRGEVDNAQARDLSNNALITNRQRDWNHDSQGNRDEEWKSGAYRDYVPNNSNEYDSVAGVGQTHDADGNLTSDGVWTYTWDGENRLATAQNALSGTWLEFKYDYRSRRVRKIERSYGILVSDHRYIYDGWNVIAELAGYDLNNLVRTFTWGLDDSGSLHGAGGVGGLLMISQGSAYYLPVYDANGNVHGLIKNGGTFAAAYGYSASGELVQSVGSYAAANPIRFASKWYDTQTGLYQYNHRNYSPSLGRFLSRDPIGEYGGLNLYAYAGNDPVNRWDYLGLSPDGGATLFVANTLYSLFERYILGKIFGGRPDRPKMFDTYTDTWRAGARFAHTFGGLGTPVQLRHGPLARAWNAAADKESKEERRKGETTQDPQGRGKILIVVVPKPDERKYGKVYQEERQNEPAIRYIEEWLDGLRESGDLDPEKVQIRVRGVTYGFGNYKEGLEKFRREAEADSYDLIVILTHGDPFGREGHSVFGVWMNNESLDPTERLVYAVIVDEFGCVVFSCASTTKRGTGVNLKELLGDLPKGTMGDLLRDKIGELNK